MTTIAYDGQHMAADSLITQDSYVVGDFMKIVAVPSGFIGLAGDVEDIILVIEWFNDGMDKDKKPEIESVNIIYVTNDGMVYCMSERLIPIPIDPPFAIGSGQDFALSAMLLGKSAKDAVEFAMTRDTSTGGAIVVVEV